LKGNCTYCNSLSKAIKNQNYCSVNGDSINTVTSNAYYFKANSLRSGKHISRLSIRSISDGYQHHQVGKRNIFLDQENFLVLNEGETFHSQISTNKDVEGLVVAFNALDIAAIKKAETQNARSLLDDPYHFSQNDFFVHTQCFSIKPELKSMLSILKKSMKSNYNVSLFYQELFTEILFWVRQESNELNQKVFNIKAKKISTKIEIARRINIIREYIDANFSEDISLIHLSKVATMSPFHLLRSFKSLFRITPHQYLIMVRLKKAKFLLRDTDYDVNTITKLVGFQNNSSFIRLFKSRTLQTPLEYRRQYNLT